MAASAEERLKKIIAEQLSVSEDEVTPEANFIDDLNADSLDLVELIMSLEEEFNVKISDEDAEKIRTVQDAMDYLHEHGGAYRRLPQTYPTFQVGRTPWHSHRHPHRRPGRYHPTRSTRPAIRR